MQFRKMNSKVNVFECVNDLFYLYIQQNIESNAEMIKYEFCITGEHLSEEFSRVTTTRHLIVCKVVFFFSK